MTTRQTPRPDPARSEPGYRGSLPARGDGLARPWILTVVGIFVLVIVLSVLGVPSRFTPDPTPPPFPSSPASSSVAPSESTVASPSLSGSPSASPSASGEASASPSP